MYMYYVILTRKFLILILAYFVVISLIRLQE